MSHVRRGVGQAPDTLRAPALVAPVVLVAALERVALARVDPLAALFVPPIATAVAFAALAPRIRAALAADLGAADRSTVWGLRRAGHATLATVVLHALALVGGAALFVVLDTPVRYVLYALDAEFVTGARGIRTAVFGVGGGIVTAWGVLAVGVVRSATGTPIREAVESALHDPLVSPLKATVTAGLHVAVFAAAAAVYAFDLVEAVPRTGAAAVVALLGVAGIAALTAAALVSHQFARADRLAATLARVSRPGVGQVAVAALLVTGLVAATGAVRVTETRPVETDPAALPDDPTGAYETAVDNTGRRNAAVTITGSDGAALTWARDRHDRQFLIRNESGDTPVYHSAGTATRMWSAFSGARPRLPAGEESATRAAPGYWFYAYDEDVSRPHSLYSPPLPMAVDGNWTVVEDGDEVVVELTEDRAVAVAILGFGISEYENFSDGLVRMRIDPERGVVTGGTARLRGTPPNGSDADPLALDLAYDVETGVDVDRPEEVNRAGPGEWGVKLLAY